MIDEEINIDRMEAAMNIIRLAEQASESGSWQSNPGDALAQVAYAERLVASIGEGAVASVSSRINALKDTFAQK